jgi:exopolyphosphatase/guanosine-5'-triphosphate,3'-diphosphate pyrophosphatase
MGAVRAQTAGWQAAEIESRLAKELKKNEDDKTAFAIGAGGTITTAAALVQGHQEYNRASVAGYSLKIGQVEELLEKFQSLSISQRCAFSPLLSRRGEIICEGLMIVGAFCRLLSLSALTVSAGGVLEGCLMELGMRNEE